MRKVRVNKLDSKDTLVNCLNQSIEKIKFLQYYFLQFSHFEIKIEENKTYSWDLKRQNMDTSKYIIEDIQNTEVGRVPGEINGKY